MICSASRRAECFLALETTSVKVAFSKRKNYSRGVATPPLRPSSLFRTRQVGELSQSANARCAFLAAFESISLYFAKIIANTAKKSRDFQIQALERMQPRGIRFNPTKGLGRASFSLATKTKHSC